MDSMIPPERRWLVDVRSRPDAAVALRDYFLRLGLSARLVEPGVVELATDEDETTLEDYTRRWVGINHVEVALRRQDALEATSLRNVAGAPGPPPRLGEVLRRKALITEAQLDAGLAESRATGELLGIALLRLGVIFEDDLARTLSEQLAIPYVSIGSVGVDLTAANMLPPRVGLELAAIPVRFKGEAVQVAFADPTDSTAVERVRTYVPRMHLAVAELSAIREAWRHLPQRV